MALENTNGNIEEAVTAAPNLGHTLIEKLLDWPFLLFVLIAYVLWRAGPNLMTFLSTRDIKVAVGDSEVTLNKAVTQLDEKATEIARDLAAEKGENRVDLEGIQAQIDRLTETLNTRIPAELGAEAGAHAPAPGEQPNGRGPLDENAMLDRMINAIREGKYTWRSIDRIALEAGITPEQALEILAGARGLVKLGIGRSGRKIARLLDD